jgi:hypothetical protein
MQNSLEAVLGCRMMPPLKHLGAAKEQSSLCHARDLAALRSVPAPRSNIKRHLSLVRTSRWSKRSRIIREEQEAAAKLLRSKPDEFTKLSDDVLMSWLADTTKITKRLLEGQGTACW